MPSIAEVTSEPPSDGHTRVRCATGTVLVSPSWVTDCGASTAAAAPMSAPAASTVTTVVGIGASLICPPCRVRAYLGTARGAVGPRPGVASLAARNLLAGLAHQGRFPGYVAGPRGRCPPGRGRRRRRPPHRSRSEERRVGEG